MSGRNICGTWRLCGIPCLSKVRFAQSRQDPQRRKMRRSLLARIERGVTMDPVTSPLIHKDSGRQAHVDLGEENPPQQTKTRIQLLFLPAIAGELRSGELIGKLRRTSVSRLVKERRDCDRVGTYFTGERLTSLQASTGRRQNNRAVVFAGSRDLLARL